MKSALRLPWKVLRSLGRVVKGVAQKQRLRRRWAGVVGGATANRSHEVQNPARVGLERCSLTYINMEHRTDRRGHFESQAASLGLKHYRRFEGVRADPGGLGCSLSHQRILQEWSTSDAELLMVCEDDALFLASRSEIDAVIEEFAADSRLSVLALANNTPWRIPISDSLAISSDIQTTACYVVKPDAVSGLLDAARTSIAGFRAGNLVGAAIDQVWKSFQREVFFAVPRRRMVVQMPSHSDIEGQWKNYGV